MTDGSSPVFYYSENNLFPRALEGTEDADPLGNFELFLEETGLRLFFSTGEERFRGFSSLKIGRFDETFEPVELFPTARNIYAVAQAADLSYRVGKTFAGSTAFYDLYQSDGENLTQRTMYRDTQVSGTCRALDLFVDDAGFTHSFLSVEQSSTGEPTTNLLLYQTSNLDGEIYSLGEEIRRNEDPSGDTLKAISDEIAFVLNESNEPVIALRDTANSVNSIGIRENGSWAFTDYVLPDRGSTRQKRLQAFIDPLNRPSLLIDRTLGFSLVSIEPSGSFSTQEFPVTSENLVMATSVDPSKSPVFIRSINYTVTLGSFTASQRVRLLDFTDLDDDGLSYLFEEAFDSDPDDSQSGKTPRFLIFNNSNPRLIADVPVGFSVTSPGIFRNDGLGITIRTELSNDLINWSLPPSSVTAEVRFLAGQASIVVTQTESVANNTASRFMRFQVTRSF